MFITESWFWRGTQSAIFYYVSCSPCVEFKYKRSRRKEAERAYKEKAEIITTQPGVIVQPGPFETNPDWAEEIIMGPGPPKGWKKEKILQGYTESARARYRSETQVPQPPARSLVAQFPNTDGAGVPDYVRPLASCKDENLNIVDFAKCETPNAAEIEIPKRVVLADSGVPAPEASLETSSSSSSSSSEGRDHIRSRPSMERRLSSAVENLKDTIKGWNLKRYEREDEILSGLNERLSRMWDKATNLASEPGAEDRKVSFTGRKRAGTTGTNESDRYDYQRAVRNPEINDLHPPTVSKLPATRDAAAWMLLPPPSAAVMAGKTRPQDESPLRWPLAQIGRDLYELEHQRMARDATTTRASESIYSAADSGKTPDLSNSSSDEGWDDEEEEEKEDDNERDKKDAQGHKRHSAPVDGWMPATPKSTARTVHPTRKPWKGDAAWRLQQAQQMIV